MPIWRRIVAENLHPLLFFVCFCCNINTLLLLHCYKKNKINPEILRVYAGSNPPRPLMGFAYLGAVISLALSLSHSFSLSLSLSLSLPIIYIILKKKQQQTKQNKNNKTIILFLSVSPYILKWAKTHSTIE